MDDDPTVVPLVPVPGRFGDAIRAGAGVPVEEPELLRVPTHFQTVEQVLETARKLDLPNCVVLAELEDGALVFLTTDMSVAQANWIVDRLKALMLAPTSNSERRGP